MAKLEELIYIYESSIKKNVRNKKKLFEFEKYKMEYFAYILELINSGNYDGGRYNIFLIYEPKIRLIMSENICDKIINHYIARFILEVKLTKYLSNCNVATRKNMGLDYGIKLLKKNIEKNKKYGDFYFLKIDISKYFYSIDHNILKNLLIDKLTNEEYKLVSSVIDSTNKEYINNKISTLGVDIRYSYGKGLPIGNMTSQFLAIFYLYKLHHYIINNLHINSLVVYMDDYLLIHPDRNYLKYCLDKIEDILCKDYLLNVSKNKTYIKSMKEGVNFLGYNIKVVNNKTIINISKSSKVKIKKNVKKIKYLQDNKKISFDKSFTSINVIKNSFKFCKDKTIENIINKYWY